MAEITPKMIREARAFLRNRGLTTSDISPREFAKAAKELSKSFLETFKHLARLHNEGQGEVSPKETRRLVEEGKLK